MATIADSRRRIKEDFGQRHKIFSTYFTPQDLRVALVSARHCWRNRIWTPAQTLWTFFVQVLHPGSSCREAVAQVLAEQAALGPAITASADPSGYCQARRRLPLAVFQYGLQKVGQRLQAQADSLHLWCGRRVWMVDGSSCSMPDTPSLQKEFGQPDGQKPGCGFPVARLVAMFCWATGAVLDLALGPYRSSELTLWQKLWHLIQPFDVVLGDRFYGAYAYLAQLMQRGCDGVFRLHGARKVDFRQGKRLGKHDHLMTWQRPKLCPRTLTPDQFEALPLELTVRVLRFSVSIPGFRSETITVVTTLLDPIRYPAERIAALYRDRWTAELRLRDIKTTLQMDVLRGQSPDVVRKEIYMHLLAYNLIRVLMWQAAVTHRQSLHRLSFVGSVQRLNALLPYLWLFAGSRKAQTLYQLLLSWIAHDRLPLRPNRVEPRARKRRPKEYSLLTKPRSEMRKALIS